MDHIRLECLKIASAEAKDAGLFASEDARDFVFARAEQLVAWVTKAPGSPAAEPEPEYERLPGSVVG